MDGLNRRLHVRSLTDIRAIASIDDRDISCVVRDRSSGGARLVFAKAVKLPARMKLTVAARCVPVDVVWFDGVQAGVRFSDPGGSEGDRATAAAARRLKR